MRYFLIAVSIILAVISLGILGLFLLVYLAWINDGGGSVLLPGPGIIISAPLILAILAVVEFFISLILFAIVRRLRK